MSDHKAWVKETAHKSPSMIYLRKALASVAKQTGAGTLQVVSEGDILETFSPINQKKIAQAAKWVLEIDDEVCFVFHNEGQKHAPAVASIDAVFQGDDGSPQEIIFNHSATLTLPD